MDEQKVQNAVKITNDLVDLQKLSDGDGMRMWEVVFNALTYEPPVVTSYESAGTPIERFLREMGGPCGAITVKQTDPEFYDQICEMFGVSLKDPSK